MIESRCHTTIDSPVGPLTLVATGSALCGLYMDAQRHRPGDGHFGVPDDLPFGLARAQLSDYFDGNLTEFSLPVAVEGTPFQQLVWAELRRIPYGETRSYGQIAAAIGRPGAGRAVGLASGRNPVGIVVPCHRVIGAAGKLTGYGGGLPRKRQLLELERGLRRLGADSASATQSI